jgi:hypothetical protein
MLVRVRNTVVAFVLILVSALLLATAAGAECTNCTHPPIAPPPRPHCVQCEAPRIVVPRGQPRQTPVFSANASARAEASAFSVSVAQARASDTVVRWNGANAAFRAEMFAAAEGEASGAPTIATAAAAATQSDGGLAILERAVRVAADCVDATGYARPAVQVFAASEVPTSYAGELYRCSAAARVRVRADGAVFDCATGDAVWYERAQLSCRRRLPREAGYEAALWRQFGAGEKLVRVRDSQAATAAPAAAFSTAGMDGGVGQGVW